MIIEPTGWLAEYAEWMAECWARDMCDRHSETIADPRQYGMLLPTNGDSYEQTESRAA